MPGKKRLRLASCSCIAAIGAGLLAACGRVELGTTADAEVTDSSTQVGAGGRRPMQRSSGGAPLSGEAGPGTLRDAGPPDVAAPEPGGSGGADGGDAAFAGFLLAERAGKTLQVVGDRAGNALVQWGLWDKPGAVHYARWNARDQTWVFPAAPDLDEATLRDPHGSGSPVVLGTGTLAGSTTPTTVIRRYDPRRDQWGDSLDLSGLQVISVNSYLDLDVRGNVHTIQRSGEFGWNECFWPREAPILGPCVRVEWAGVRVVAGHGALLWDGLNAFRVRRFDEATNTWLRDGVELWPLMRDPSNRTIALGASGEALAVMWRYADDAVVVEARRMNHVDGTWGDVETVTTVPRDQEIRYYFSSFVTTDALHQDFVTAGVQLPSGEMETGVFRYDIGTREWSLSRTINPVPNTSTDVATDDHGNVYARGSSGTLLRWNPSTLTWTDTVVGLMAVHFIPAATGVVAIGTKDGELTGLRHVPDRDEWVPVKGLPTGIEPGYFSLGQIPFAVARVGSDGGIVAWTVGGEVRAVFVE